MGDGGSASMPTTEEENAALVRRYLFDVVDGGDVEASEILLAADVQATVTHTTDRGWTDAERSLNRANTIWHIIHTRPCDYIDWSESVPHASIFV